MKKFEIVWELPTRDTETQREQVLLEKWCQETCSTQGHYKPSVCEYSISVKCDKEMHSKIRYAHNNRKSKVSEHSVTRGSMFSN